MVLIIFIFILIELQTGLRSETSTIGINSTTNYLLNIHVERGEYANFKIFYYVDDEESIELKDDFECQTSFNLKNNVTLSFNNTLSNFLI
jgi:hypothetical protein